MLIDGSCWRLLCSEYREYLSIINSKAHCLDRSANIRANQTHTQLLLHSSPLPVLRFNWQTFFSFLLPDALLKLAHTENECHAWLYTHLLNSSPLPPPLLVSTLQADAFGLQPGIQAHIIACPPWCSDEYAYT